MPTMKLLLSLSIALVLSIFGLLACSEVPANGIPPLGLTGAVPVKKAMRNFSSEQELARFLRELAEKSRRERGLVNKQAETVATPASVANEPSSKDEESVTNVQHAGVDEGGIVKVHGDHLVVLR